MLETDLCYKILGLGSDASFKEVREAYRKLSLLYHPDKNKTGEADSKFKLISEAYQTLKQEQKKENARHKDAEKAHTEFWQYYDKDTSSNVDFEYTYRQFWRNFGPPTKPEQEKPISHKMTHLLLYGGLGAIALWIILSELFK